MVLDNGRLRAVKMEVVNAKLKGGKWVYQLKRSGVLYADETGNWFREDKLDWWN